MAASATLAKRTAILTDDEFLALNISGKAEWVNGHISEMPASWLHDILVARIIALLAPYAAEIGWLAGSQAGFRMPGGNICCPDVSVASFNRVTRGESLPAVGSGAPDLCIDVLSPAETRESVETKLREYFSAGCVTAWLVDPITKSITVHTGVDRFSVLNEDAQLNGAPVIPLFSLPVREIFNLPMPPK